MRILVTGGIKAGKSRRALEAARTYFPLPAVFLATAEALDDEMRARIERHKEERAASPDSFITVEEPLEIDRAAASVRGSLVLDCVPMWVNNLMHYGREGDFDRILDALVRGLPADCAVVTNETGWGNVPFDPLTRRYNVLLAEANRRLAAACDVVELMVAGLPLRVKG